MTDDMKILALAIAEAGVQVALVGELLTSTDKQEYTAGFLKVLDRVITAIVEEEFTSLQDLDAHLVSVAGRVKADLESDTPQVSKHVAKGYYDGVDSVRKAIRIQLEEAARHN